MPEAIVLLASVFALVRRFALRILTWKFLLSMNCNEMAVKVAFTIFTFDNGAATRDSTAERLLTTFTIWLHGFIVLWNNFVVTGIIRELRIICVGRKVL